MKSIFNYFTASILAITALVSCSVEDRATEDTNVFFENVSYPRTVSSTVTYVDVDVPYKLTIPAEGNHEVNFTFEPSLSNTVQGTDFQILGSSQITGGQSEGVVKLRLFSAPASPQGKIAAFKISSPTLPNVLDKQIATVQITKTCPISTFFGSFNYVSGWFGTPGDTYQVVQDPTNPNGLLIKNFLNSGDLPLTYDPISYQITVPTMATGYTDPTYGPVTIRPALDGSKSQFNTCNRTIDLRVSYIVSAGSFGNYTEKFQGN
ncbi:hypothetical protein SAMN05421682_101111 [Chryseobacterium indoltheticum]|uniref:DUF4843 domain-containing protein n=1 Tax=Chryseobacterium indoltheticum TaxID=254 RepID=A0A381F7E8_9FLAO|nr:hypothetical protein EG358_03175 [Chryseobacterium indoltheticum]SIP87390.1 hypothetical protein SAMN05421682_101111 [Chryseobacterium indoltheticum]SUX42423.1 Uncharacterised protein [Chryseobacterium indoltheticum]